MSEFEIELGGQKTTAGLADIAGLDITGFSENDGSFQVTPKGVYDFAIKDAKIEQVGDGPAITIETEIDKCHTIISDELTEETVVGTKHREVFFLSKAEGGVGKLLYLANHTGFTTQQTTLQPILDEMIGHKFTGMVKHRKDKNDPDKIYSGIDLKSVKPIGV